MRPGISALIFTLVLITLHGSIKEIERVLREADPLSLRIPYVNGCWLFSRIIDELTHVEYIIHTDPGNYLPSWLVNGAIWETPYNTLINLKEQLEDRSKSR